MAVYFRAFYEIFKSFRSPFLLVCCWVTTEWEEWVCWLWSSRHISWTLLPWALQTTSLLFCCNFVWNLPATVDMQDWNLKGKEGGRERYIPFDCFLFLITLAKQHVSSQSFLKGWLICLQHFQSSCQSEITAISTGVLSSELSPSSARSLLLPKVPGLVACIHFLEVWC